MRYFLIGFFFIPCLLTAQKVQNVRLLQEGDALLSQYDLHPGTEDDRYEAGLYYSLDGGASFRGPARLVAGSVGPVQPGLNRQIRWQVREELGPILIEQFQVEVRVRVLRGTPPKSFDFVPEMVRVEGGCFSMGSNEEEDDEKPVHAVRLQSFEIGKYEVTQKEWVAVMGDNPSRFKCEECPVENVSWEDVQTYIRKLNEKTGLSYRLPTEAEWEFAARGGSSSRGYTYAGSNSVDEVGWYAENGGRKTHPVGKKGANELGLYDMSGNVWEWCQDRYHSSYAGAPSDGSAWERGGSSYRVLRGGGWVDVPATLMVNFRNRYGPEVRIFFVGFRLARTL